MTSANEQNIKTETINKVAVMLQEMKIDGETLNRWEVGQPNRYEDWKKEAYGFNLALDESISKLSEL